MQRLRRAMVLVLRWKLFNYHSSLLERFHQQVERPVVAVAAVVVVQQPPVDPVVGSLAAL